MFCYVGTPVIKLDAGDGAGQLSNLIPAYFQLTSKSLASAYNKLNFPSTFNSPYDTFLLTVFPRHVFRCHNSTGDLKRLDTSVPPFSSSSPSDTEPQGFRRRASTYSHSPSPSSALEYSPLHKLTRTPQDPSAATKPKLVRHYSVSTDSPHQSK